MVSRNWPCTSTRNCPHCAMLPEIRTAISQAGITVVGPSPALSLRERDPFIDDFFRAFGKDHTVVGDSYVHGIMNGEAVQDVDWDNGGYEVLDLV